MLQQEFEQEPKGLNTSQLCYHSFTKSLENKELIFKILLVYKYFNGIAPSYVSDILTEYIWERIFSLWSHSLEFFATRTTLWCNCVYVNKQTKDICYFTRFKLSFNLFYYLPLLILHYFIVFWVCIYRICLTFLCLGGHLIPFYHVMFICCEFKAHWVYCRVEYVI